MAVERVGATHLRVKTDTVDVAIELTGPKPGSRKGTTVRKQFDPNRGGLRRQVTVTSFCYLNEFGFENAILAAFEAFANGSEPLPDYLNDPFKWQFNNSNTFANHLVMTRGGTIDSIPLRAFGASSRFK